MKHRQRHAGRGRGKGRGKDIQAEAEAEGEAEAEVDAETESETKGEAEAEVVREKYSMASQYASLGSAKLILTRVLQKKRSTDSFHHVIPIVQYYIYIILFRA